MKPLLFRMRQETEMEKFRAATFWQKEPETLAWIESFSPTDVFFDVGANVGVYSLYAASLYPEMQILAFEPMPYNYQRLLDNVRMNGFKNIGCIPFALGERRHHGHFEFKNNEIGSSGGGISNEGSEMLIVTLDEIFESEEDIERVNLKIDVDGGEYDIVLGGILMIQYIKSALIEVSSANKQPIIDFMIRSCFTTDNRFNKMTPHSRERREREGIDAENIVFTR